jgi:hypothetical protein
MSLQPALAWSLVLRVDTARKSKKGSAFTALAAAELQQNSKTAKQQNSKTAK